MKPYPSAMKEKRRYIVLEFITDKKARLSKSQAQHVLWDAVFDFIGKQGAAECSFWVLDFDEKTQRTIVRCTNQGLDRIRAALALFKGFESQQKRFIKGFIHIIQVTGTIKKAKLRMSSNK